MHPWDVELVAQAAVMDARALIDAAAAGDEHAFAEIVRRHHEDMRRVTKAVVGDDVIADDAVEAAWTIAWRKIGTIRDPARLRPWLVSVAVNEGRQLMRKANRRAVTEISFVHGTERMGGID